MSTEVVTPEEYVGEVISDFNRSKRQSGRYGIESRRKQSLKAKVPLANSLCYDSYFDYSGRATSTMEFSHYETGTWQNHELRNYKRKNSFKR